MRVLVACEKSGRVREAFAWLGHDAWSCDVQASDIPGNHIQDDVLNRLADGWDLMIAHPPCQYLSYAGMASWHKPGRDALRHAAAEFFMALVNAPINKICLENPRGYMSKYYRQCDQVIHPWYFGEPQMKRTCLWLKNLPKLEWTKENDLFGLATATTKPAPRYLTLDSKTNKFKKRYFTDSLSSYQKQKRSITFQAIAEAMAKQWG